MKEESSQIEVEVVRETDKAFLCRRPGTTDEQWLPKSQVYWKRKKAGGTGGTLDVPDWLLDKLNW